MSSGVPKSLDEKGERKKKGGGELAYLSRSHGQTGIVRRRPDPVSSEVPVWDELSSFWNRLCLVFSLDRH